MYYWINKEKILKYGEVVRRVIKKIEYDLEDEQYRFIFSFCFGEKIEKFT